MSRGHKILHLEHIPATAQEEADAFLRRVAACKDSREVQELVKKTKELYAPEPLSAPQAEQETK